MTFVKSDGESSAEMFTSLISDKVRFFLTEPKKPKFFRFGSVRFETQVRFGSVFKNIKVRFSVISVRFGFRPNRPFAQP